jgi:hypothetical protein
MSATLSPISSSEPVSTASNRRRHDRFDFRTAVVAIVSEPTGFRCIRCQTDDLSFEGARLVCFEPIPTKSVFVRILMPELAERFMEAEIMNERVQSELRIGAGRVKRYTYGVRFKRVISDAAMLDQLHIAATARAPSVRD